MLFRRKMTAEVIGLVPSPEYKPPVLALDPPKTNLDPYKAFNEIRKELWHVSVAGWGGSWCIISASGHIVASEVPHGWLADYIAKLHNDTLEGPADG